MQPTTILARTPWSYYCCCRCCFYWFSSFCCKCLIIHDYMPLLVGMGQSKLNTILGLNTPLHPFPWRGGEDNSFQSPDAFQVLDQIFYSCFYLTKTNSWTNFFLTPFLKPNFLNQIFLRRIVWTTNLMLFLYKLG